MTEAAVKPSSPAAARTRLLLEGPIVPTLLRLAVPNLVVNVVLIAVTTSIDAHFARRIAWIAVGLSACVMASVSVLAIATPDAWMRLFSHDQAILAAAAPYLAIVGLAYPFVATNTLMSAFQSTRQPEWPLTAMTCRLLAVVVGAGSPSRSFTRTSPGWASSPPSVSPPRASCWPAPSVSTPA